MTVSGNYVDVSPAFNSALWSLVVIAGGGVLDALDVRPADHRQALVPEHGRGVVGARHRDGGLLRPLLSVPRPVRPRGVGRAARTAG